MTHRKGEDEFVKPLDASVVIPTRNRAALLRRCLAAVFEQSGLSFEIVVVNDGSTDDTRRVLGDAASGDVPLQVIALPGQSGPARARNAGWRAARSGIVAFTDDDCEPASDWLTVLRRRLDQEGPKVVGVGGRVLAAGDGPISKYMQYHRILEPPPSVSYLITANCAYRRAALQEVGGFDERVRTPGGEDPGLSFALGERGYEFAFEPGAVVQHHFRESVRDFARTFFRYGRGCRVVGG